MEKLHTRALDSLEGQVIIVIRVVIPIAREERRDMECKVEHTPMLPRTHGSSIIKLNQVWVLISRAASESMIFVDYSEQKQRRRNGPSKGHEGARVTARSYKIDRLAYRSLGRVDD